MTEVGTGESPSPNPDRNKEETKMATYVKAFFGTAEGVEAAIRTFDKVFRMRYNVHGGKREVTYKNHEGEYTVIMSYTADWCDFGGLFPEYTFYGIERTFYHWMNRHPLNNEFYCDKGKRTER